MKLRRNIISHWEHYEVCLICININNNEMWTSLLTSLITFNSSLHMFLFSSHSLMFSPLPSDFLWNDISTQYFSFKHWCQAQGMFCFSSFSEATQLDMAGGFSVAPPLLSLSVLLSSCLMLRWKKRWMFHLSDFHFICKTQMRVLVLELVLPLELPLMIICAAALMLLHMQR